MKKIRKRYIEIVFVFLLIFILILTNPTKQDYLQFSEERTGMPTPEIEEIERINFFIFSTYTPVVKLEYGITHLGVFNHFFQISKGQFDYPKWLDIFN